MAKPQNQTNTEFSIYTTKLNSLFLTLQIPAAEHAVSQNAIVDLEPEIEFNARRLPYTSDDLCFRFKRVVKRSNSGERIKKVCLALTISSQIVAYPEIFKLDNFFHLEV